MKLQIDIPDWLYNDIINYGASRYSPEIYWAISKGTPIHAGLYMLFNKNSSMCWSDREGENEALFEAVKHSAIGHIKESVFTPVVDIFKSLGLSTNECRHYKTGWKQGDEFGFRWHERDEKNTYDLYFTNMTEI